MIKLKTQTEIEYIRKADKILADTFEMLKPYIKPGITTKELDKIAEDFILSRGARPSFKGYAPSVTFPKYPAATCISVNEEVIHGIPGNRVLKEGDLVSVDIGTELSGYYGDSARSYLVGNVDDKVRKLSEDTKKALMLAIDICRPGAYLNEIGKAISFYLSPRGYGIVRDYCGHGVGYAVHEEPPVVNYYNPKQKGPRLKKGMVIAIEPMITLGGHKVTTRPDLWTVITVDGSTAAHWEHSIAITDGEADILSI